jgi:hypothetical protein
MNKGLAAGRFLKWLAGSVVFSALVIGGTVGGSEGAANVARFFAWLVFIVSLGLFSDDIARTVREKPRSAPLWLMGTVDALLIGLMVWYGWFVTAAAFTFAVILTASAHLRSDKEATAR